MEGPASHAPEPSGNSRSLSPRSKTHDDKRAGTFCGTIAEASPLRCSSGNILSLEASTNESVGSSRLSSSDSTSLTALHIHAAPGDSGHCCAAPTGISLHKSTGETGGEKCNSISLPPSEYCMAASKDLEQSVRRTKTAHDMEEHQAADDLVPYQLNQADVKVRESEKMCGRPHRPDSVGDVQNVATWNELAHWRVSDEKLSRYSSSSADCAAICESASPESKIEPNLILRASRSSGTAAESFTCPRGGSLPCTTVTSPEQKGRPPTQSQQIEFVRECTVAGTGGDLLESAPLQAPTEPTDAHSKVSLADLDSPRTGKDNNADEENASFTMDDKGNSCSVRKWQDGGSPFADHNANDLPGKVVGTDTPRSGYAKNISISPVALQQAGKKQRNKRMLHANRLHHQVATRQAEGPLSTVTESSIDAATNAGTTDSAFNSPGSTYVETASTTSVSISRISKSVSSSFTAVPTFPSVPANLSSERLGETQVPPSQSSRESECVDGSCKESANSDSKLLTENVRRTHLRRTQEQSRRAGASFETTLYSSVLSCDGATAGPPSSCRASRTTSPVLLEPSKGSTASPSNTLPFSQRLPSGRGSRIFRATAGDATLGESVTTSCLYLQDGSDEVSLLSSKGSPATAGDGHHTYDAVLCSGNASRSRLRTDGGSCRNCSARLPSEQRASGKEPAYADPLWKRVKPLQRQACLKSASLTLSTDPYPLSSSDQSASSSTNRECEAASAHQGGAPHPNEAILSRMSTCATRDVHSPKNWEHREALIPSEQSCLHQRAQQSSAVVAGGQKDHHYTSSPHQGDVEKASLIRVSHMELSCEETKTEESIFKPRLVPSGELKMTHGRQEQQAFSSPLDVLHPHVSRTTSSTFQCQRRPKAEHTAFVLDELQQLQELLGTGFGGGDPSLKESLQHRLCQLQSALQQLLCPDTDGEDFSKRRTQVRVPYATQNLVSCSSTFHTLSGWTTAPHLSPMFESEEVVGPARGAQKCVDAHSVITEDAIDHVSPLGNHTVSVSNGDRAAESRRWTQRERREMTDSMSPKAMLNLSRTAAVDEHAATSDLLASASGPPCVVTSTRGTQAEQMRAAQAKVARLNEEFLNRDSAGERDPELHVEKQRIEKCDIVDCSASCTSPIDPLIGIFYQKDQACLDSSRSRQNFAANDRIDQSATRCGRRRSIGAAVLASSADAPAIGKGEGATHNGGPPTSETSISDTGLGSPGDSSTPQTACDRARKYSRPSTLVEKTDFPQCRLIPGCKSGLSSASTCQAASDVGNKCQHPLAIVDATDDPQCSSIPVHERGVRPQSITTGTRTQERQNKVNQGGAPSPIAKKSPATVTGSHWAQPEEQSSVWVSCDKAKGMCARRATRSICLRPRGRRRRSSDVRHISRWFRRSMPPGRKFISKTREGGESEQSQQKVHYDASLLGFELQEREAGDYGTLPAVDRKAAFHSSESGAVCSSSLEDKDALPEACAQEGRVHIAKTFCQDVVADYSKGKAASSDSPSGTQSAEAKPTDETSASSKDTQRMSTNRTQPTATADGDAGTIDSSDIHQQPKSCSTMVQVACRRETPRPGAASASPLNAEVVRAMLSFMQRHLPTPQGKDEADDQKGADCLPTSTLQLDSGKKGDLLPAGGCKDAHSGLLLASCLGVVAGCGGFNIFKDLCRLLNNVMPEQANKDGNESAERNDVSGRSKDETLHATTEARAHDSANDVLPRQSACAAARKPAVPPGGWTAGRAATRVTQKEHREPKKMVRSQDEMVEESGHLQSTSLSSVLERKAPLKKTDCSVTEAAAAERSRHSCKRASRPSSREGSGIRWELLRTARRAAHRKEREESAERNSAKPGHSRNSVRNADRRRDKQEGHGSTVSLVLTPQSSIGPSSNDISWCGSALHIERDKTGGTSHSSVNTDEVQSDWSQLSTTKKCSATQGETPLQEPKPSCEQRSEERLSPPRSGRSLTDDEHLSADDLPTFDDVFNLPDLIPDAWYEEAEGSGKPGSCVSSGEGHSHQAVTKNLKQAGQWVLEHETSILQHDASGEETKSHLGFFSMMLEEKQRAPPPSELFEGRTPAAGRTSHLPTIWSVPDDLIELIESVPGGSPSALRPPCALRLLPTSSSSSSPSKDSTSRSSANSSSSFASSSSSSSSPSASSLSRPSSGSMSPQVKEPSASKKVSVTSKGNSLVKRSPFHMVTPQQRSPAAARWIFESSSEYDEHSGDVESSQSSECEQVEDATCRSQDFDVEPICEEDIKEHGVTTDLMLSYAGSVGFLHRALAHEGVRSKITHPLPEFISLCRSKSSSSPFERRNQSKRAKAKRSLRDRRSRTQPPTRGLSSDRPTKDQKRRRRHRREECLKQRLAALRRDNLSHEEYMGQFARRMSMTAVHKVFCIELTKADRCAAPSTNSPDDVGTDERISTHLARNNAATAATVTAPWSALGGELSPGSRAEIACTGGRLSTQGKFTTAAGRPAATSPALTIEACIADQLRHRGWVMNRLLIDSHFFDLKWKLSDVDEDYRSLRREQFFNHFQNNRAITTKGGLARSFRRLAVDEQVHIDFFFPRCYHLSNLDECSDFLLDYSRCEAVTVLLAYLRCYQATPDEFHTAMVAEPLPSNSLRRSAALLVWMAYHIASIWLHELNPDSYLDITETIEQQGRLDPQRLEVFASHAWHFRSQTQAFLREWHAITRCGSALCAAVHNNETLEEEAALSLVKEGGLFSWNTKNLSRAPLGSQVLRLLKQLQMRWPLWRLERGVFNLEDLKASEKDCTLDDESVIGSKEGVHQAEQNSRADGENALKSGIRDPCWKQHNVWIMKPSSNSKASGIYCLNNPWEILRAGRGLSDRLIQKYVEQPLLLPCQTKFDMRQWVLVRSFDPLRVYMFSKVYLRLCSEKYDLRDLQNRFRHVCNRHLNKLNSDPQQCCSGSTAKDASVYPNACGTYNGACGTASGFDSCQPLAELEALLADRTDNPNFFQENVMPQIRHIVLQTVRAARPFVTPRPNSFELYGFDILLDASYRAWLIEVNLSPACAASAEWQKQMVKQMTSGLVDLLFNNNDGETVRPLNEKNVKPGDAGYWALVFDESVDPCEAVHVFPSVEPADKTLAVGYHRGHENPYLQFYSQPVHKKGGSSSAPRAARCTTGACCLANNTRADDKPRNLQVIGPAAASWDKLVVTGAHLPRHEDATLDAWCRFTEAKNRIISWWRRSAWKRRAAKRKRLSLHEDIEVDYFFSLF